MNVGRAAENRNLRGLKSISWLSSRQLNRLAAARSMRAVKKREIIIDGKHSPESAYRLLSGVARITRRNRKGDRLLPSSLLLLRSLSIGGRLAAPRVKRDP